MSERQPHPIRASARLQAATIGLRLASAALSCGAFAFAVSGCSTSVAPIEVGEGCPEGPLRGPLKTASAAESMLIDDFEHETSSLPRLGGRDGGWVLGTDGTSTRVRARSSGSCAARGQRAGHFTGEGLSDWGANWTAALRSHPSGTAVAYDGTPYSGVSFWAATSAQVEAPIALPVGVTTMDVAWNGGICSKCMDFYRTSISIDHVWRRFQLRFDELEQEGTGDPQVALRAEQLVGVIFWPEADSDFDLWVDDLRFE